MKSFTMSLPPMAPLSNEPILLTPNLLHLGGIPPPFSTAYFMTWSKRWFYSFTVYLSTFAALRWYNEKTFGCSKHHDLLAGIFGKTKESIKNPSECSRDRTHKIMIITKHILAGGFK